MNETPEILPPPRPQHATMIKNLVPRLPERGHVKIGIKGEMVTSQRGRQFQPPQKLDHFRITTMERGRDGNFLIDQGFHAKYGEKPTEIPVRLLYDDPSLNFPTRYACFIGRSLWCSGDGQSAMRMTEAPQEMLKEVRTLSPRPVACTCPRQEPTYQARDKCKMNGNLSVLIDGMGGVGGVWKFRTTSYNSIVGIMSSMAFLRSVTGGVLANIPFRLTLRPKQASNPNDGAQVTIYVVGLEFDGDIAELQDVGHRIALDRATTHVSIKHIEDEARKLLSFTQPDVPLPGDEAREIVEEFYPEQVDGSQEMPAPPRPRREDFVAPQALDPEPEPFEVIDMAGNVLPYPSLSNAFAEYRLALAEGEKHGGESGLTTVWDNNQGFMRQLDERGHEALSRELSLEYGRMREKAAARATPSAPLSPAAGGEPEAPNTDSSPNPNRAKEVMPNEERRPAEPRVDKTAPPVMGATDPVRVAESIPGPSAALPRIGDDRTAGSTPATGATAGPVAQGTERPPSKRDAAGSSPAGLAPPPRRQPPRGQMDALRETAQQSRLGLGVSYLGEPTHEVDQIESTESTERPSLAIKPVESQGKPEWHVWLVSQLLPALKSTTTSNELADLLGDNEEYIADALKVLPKEDIAEFIAARSHQWDVIGKAGG